MHLESSPQEFQHLFIQILFIPINSKLPFADLMQPIWQFWQQYLDTWHASISGHCMNIMQELCKDVHM